MKILSLFLIFLVHVVFGGNSQAATGQKRPNEDALKNALNSIGTKQLDLNSIQNGSLKMDLSKLANIIPQAAKNPADVAQPKPAAAGQPNPIPAAQQKPADAAAAKSNPDAPNAAPTNDKSCGIGAIFDSVSNTLKDNNFDFSKFKPALKDLLTKAEVPDVDAIVDKAQGFSDEAKADPSNQNNVIQKARDYFTSFCNKIHQAQSGPAGGDKPADGNGDKAGAVGKLAELFQGNGKVDVKSAVQMVQVVLNQQPNLDQTKKDEALKQVNDFANKYQQAANDGDKAKVVNEVKANFLPKVMSLLGGKPSDNKPDGSGDSSKPAAAPVAQQPQDQGMFGNMLKLLQKDGKFDINAALQMLQTFLEKSKLEQKQKDEIMQQAKEFANRYQQASDADKPKILAEAKAALLQRVIPLLTGNPGANGGNQPAVAADGKPVAPQMGNAFCSGAVKTFVESLIKNDYKIVGNIDQSEIQKGLEKLNIDKLNSENIFQKMNGFAEKLKAAQSDEAERAKVIQQATDECVSLFNKPANKDQSQQPGSAGGDSKPAGPPADDGNKPAPADSEVKPAANLPSAQVLIGQSEAKLNEAAQVVSANVDPKVLSDVQTVLKSIESEPEKVLDKAKVDDIEANIDKMVEQIGKEPNNDKQKSASNVVSIVKQTIDKAKSNPNAKDAKGVIGNVLNGLLNKSKPKQ